MDHVTVFNRQFHDHLAAHGEGLHSIVFGVKNVETHRERIMTLGVGASDIMKDDPSTPWAGKVKLKEFIVGQNGMATPLVFGEIECGEGVIAVQ